MSDPEVKRSGVSAVDPDPLEPHDVAPRAPRPPGRPAAFGLVAALLLPGFVPAAGTATADPATADSFAASTAEPWNPPRPMSRRAGWEHAALLPGRVVSLPFVAIGRASEYLLYQAEQSPRFSGAFALPARAGGFGVGVRDPRLGDRTGLGAALEVHTVLLRGAASSRLSAEYAGTLHQYGRTLLTWTGRPLSVQFGEEWRPQDRFYGIGNAAAEAGASDYAVSHAFVRAGLGWATNRLRDPNRARSEFGLWTGPRSTVTRTGREPGVPSYDTRHPGPGVTLNRRVERLVHGARLLYDARRGAPHWSRGWRTLLAVERAGAPVRALALRSASGDGDPYTRVQAEAEAGVSFMRDPRTLRLLVRMTDLGAPAHGVRLLPSDLSSLGGQPGLGGFIPGRFHDMDLLLTRLDYVFPLQRSFEFDLHSEWGAVYPDVWRDAALRTLHHSLGFALRSRSERSPSGSIGFDFCAEGARLRFSLGGVE